MNIHKPQIILMPVSNGAVARNLLRGGFAEMLRARGARLILLAPPGKRAYYEKHFFGEHIVWDNLPLAAEKKWAFAERASLPTRTMYLMHCYEFYRRGSQSHFITRLGSLCVRLTLWFIGHLRTYRAFFRYLYARGRSRAFQEILRRHQPDIVFCPTLIYGGEYALMREAKRQGIKTIGMAASWDNFTSKTLLRVHPDMLLAQTKIMKRDAVRYGDFPLSRISVVGVPQYDAHFLRTGLPSREAFFKKIGGNPEKQLILFAFSGKVSVNADWGALEILNSAFQNGELPRDKIQVLVRPYPKRKLCASEYARIRDEFGFLIESPVSRVGIGKDAWEFDDESLSFMRGSIVNSAVVVSACSTFFVEAAIFDRPLVAVAFGPVGADYWNSAARFFEWNHLADLKKTGGIARTTTRHDFIQEIQKALSHNEERRAGRAVITEEQAGFTDGDSLKRIADALLKNSCTRKKSFICGEK